MQVTVSNEIDACGTCLLGEIDLSYDEIVALLGEPTSGGDGYKVDAEWNLEFEDGTIATLYNYKSGPNYNQDGSDVRDIRDWHIGGRFDGPTHAVKYVNDLFDGAGSYEILRIDGPVS